MPKIIPIADESDVAPEHQDIVANVVKIFGEIRGPQSILLHSPKLAEVTLELGNYFRYSTVVKAPLRSLATIAAAREKDCLYIWAQQVAAARRAGLSEETIAVVRDGTETSSLDSDELAVVTYVHELLRKNRVSQQVFEDLNSRFGTQWVIEMTTMVGYYCLLADLTNAVDLGPAPDGEQLPDRAKSVTNATSN